LSTTGDEALGTLRSVVTFEQFGQLDGSAGQTETLPEAQYRIAATQNMTSISADNLQKLLEILNFMTTL